MIDDLRPYDPIADRAAAQAVIRSAFARDDTGYTIHPGDWDWWRFHPRPTSPGARILIGERVLVEFEPQSGELSVVGATPGETIDLVDRFDDDGAVVSTVGWALTRDEPRRAALASRGFAPQGKPWPIFLRPTAGGVEGLRPLPDGFTIRPLAGDNEAPSRSAAARRAFDSTMAPYAHVARYRAFMASPAYERERDIVAIAPDGRVASFAVHWLDHELSLAQFEPVGTDPDYMRLGISRAVIGSSLARIAAAGVKAARVTTHGDNDAAQALYASCGFDVVDHVEWWHRPA